MRPPEKENYDQIYSESGKIEELYSSPKNSKIDYVVNWAKNYDRVLDAGCGKGSILRHLKDQVDEVFGIELSSVCCDKYLQDLPHECVGIFEYCSNKPQWDAVYSTDVLEHIPPAELHETLSALSGISNNFLFLVATGSDPKLGYELHISNHNFMEWDCILSMHFNVTKKIDGFDEWPYIHIFECENK